jgi:hypothetical protein
VGLRDSRGLDHDKVEAGCLAHGDHVRQVGRHLGVAAARASNRNTRLSPSRFIRIRSPGSALPPRRRLGSMASTAGVQRVVMVEPQSADQLVGGRRLGRAAVPVKPRTRPCLQTSDFYELIVERHQRASTILTSNRDPSEWIAAMRDPLLARFAVDRLVSTNYQLVIKGEPYRRREGPTGASSASH